MERKKIIKELKKQLKLLSKRSEDLMNAEVATKVALAIKDIGYEINRLSAFERAAVARAAVDVEERKATAEALHGAIDRLGK